MVIKGEHTAEERIFWGATSQGKDEDAFRIGNREFKSRLLACVAAQFSSSRCLPLETALEVVERSGTEFLIFNVMTPREIRQNSNRMPSEVIAIEDILDRLNSKNYTVLNNTNRCTSVKEAVEKAFYSVSVTGSPLVKLEILDEALFPVNTLTIEAAKELLQEGLEVLPFITQDLRAANELRILGCPALRVLGSPIGSMRGVETPTRFEKICSEIGVPVIAEGGMGTPAQVCEAMLLGAGGVLVNAAFARSPRPGLLADAMKLAVISGRKGFLARQAGTEEPGKQGYVCV